MGARVVRKSRLGDFIDKMKRVDKSKVEIGVFDTSFYPDGTPVAYVAAIQEFGYSPKNIPSRSFMRSTLVERDADIKNTIRQGGAKLAAGEITPAFFLDVIGSSMAGAIQQKIKSIDSPPLAASTLTARHRNKQGQSASGDKPLVFTGVLLSSIAYKVTL